MADTQKPRRDPLPLAFDDPAGAPGPDARPTSGHDPRSRWRTMPRPVMPDEWVGEHDTDPVPDSIRDAEAARESREARWLLERGGGLGA